MCIRDRYKYSSYDYLEKLELVPNESYFGSKASLDACVVILPEKELASNMMEIDAVTCYIDDNLSRYSLVSDKNFKMYDMISNDAEFMVFNTKEGPFKDKKDVYKRQYQDSKGNERNYSVPIHRHSLLFFIKNE